MLTLRVREYFIYLRRATIVLQSAWRGRRVRREMERTKLAVVKVQRYWRGVITRRRVEKLRSQKKEGVADFKKRRAVMVIERWWRLQSLLMKGRRNISKVVRIQRVWREYLVRKREKQRRNKAATIVQSLWRGYCVRHFKKNRFSLSTSGVKILDEAQLKRLTLVRKRLDEANAKGDSMSMGQRTKIAIAIILRGKDLQTLLQAVVTLEVSTRWLSSSCESVASPVVLKVLLKLIQNSNRSLPYLHILHYVIDVFINLIKCPSTYMNTAKSPDLLQILVQLCINFYEKSPRLLTKCCTALYLLTTGTREGKLVVPSSCKSDVNKLLNLMVRKATVKAGNSKKFSPPATLSTALCPSHSPQYFLTAKNHREFTHPLTSIVTLQSVWEKLSVDA